MKAEKVIVCKVDVIVVHVCDSHVQRETEIYYTAQ